MSWTVTSVRQRHARQVLQLATLTCGALWHAGRVWETQREHAAACLHQEGVRVPVVAPCELDQLHGEEPTRVGLTCALVRVSCCCIYDMLDNLQVIRHGQSRKHTLPALCNVTRLNIANMIWRTFSRPVYARMRRSTERHASVPLLTKRTISTLGTRSITACAITFCRARQVRWRRPGGCGAASTFSFYTTCGESGSSAGRVMLLAPRACSRGLL